VSGFLRGVKRAIPWLAALFLLGGLAVVVVTCWLRKGVLLQNLSTGGGKTGAGKPRVDQKRAAEYLERVRQRQAAARAEEAARAGTAKPKQEPGHKPR
jgi:hypothetical protein